MKMDEKHSNGSVPVDRDVTNGRNDQVDVNQPSAQHDDPAASVDPHDQVDVNAHPPAGQENSSSVEDMNKRRDKMMSVLNENLIRVEQEFSDFRGEVVTALQKRDKVWQEKINRLENKQAAPRTDNQEIIEAEMKCGCCRYYNNRHYNLFEIVVYVGLFLVSLVVVVATIRGQPVESILSTAGQNVTVPAHPLPNCAGASGCWSISQLMMILIIPIILVFLLCYGKGYISGIHVSICVASCLICFAWLQSCVSRVRNDLFSKVVCVFLLLVVFATGTDRRDPSRHLSI